MLRQRPTLSCANLRQFFVRYMTHFQAVDAQLISNLRRRIVRFILLHEFEDLPTSNEAVMLSDPKAFAANKLCLGENVPFTCNLKKLLQKVMQEDLLESLHISGWDDSGKSQQLTQSQVWRQRLSRGHCMDVFGRQSGSYTIRWCSFLDAMKRNYNKPGWTYIGPRVKDN